MSYVNGFVAAVPTANREAYRLHPEEAAGLFREHGGLSVVECWGDDVPDGEVTSFPDLQEQRIAIKVGLTHESHRT